MKKIGFLLSILMVAGVCAMADPIVPSADSTGLGAGYTKLSDEEMTLVEGDGLGGAILCGTVASVGLVAGTLLLYSTYPAIAWRLDINALVLSLIISGPAAAWKWGWANLPF